MPFFSAPKGYKSRRFLVSWGAAALSLSITGGCEPAPPSPAELDRVVVDPQQIPGTEKRFALPKFKDDAAPASPAGAGARDEHAGHDHD